MNHMTAIQYLNKFDQQGRYVFTTKDLAKVFSEDSKRAFEAGLNRLVKHGVLLRACKGIYVFALSQHNGLDTLELIARAMRRGEYSYVSLESALSQYGAISQIPIDRLTIMTTGREGTYRTPFGTIEFTHTKRSVPDIINNIKEIGRPLRLASKQTAYRDLKRVGRNIHLVEKEVINED
ncbi:type IV toxin-antitoxin system AbiEi family antitoxin domain-containing protein [Xenorhabdus sp. PB61.4]|uniref:type IV toxin-antitoxin system AbiEi family antitoxin n=1 Tax=Xenorhabdus sp. PB61.4 TaxID=2788940 RepID=UPI001E560396|nr:type IV toxin-antitoxin system AbiEi family antitoxin domain-containing protein [Xenorhabdus sp. PB61.4]MCC8366259.1 type IV toxin-antitoxin system AbiEi family antitoxin domain-containing protein [Xenorhabdus sp. PB61.4]